MTEYDTFEHLPSWLAATVALVGNMADRPASQLAVSKEEAQAFAQQNEYVGR